MVIASGNVTYSNIIRQAHANVFNLINTRANVADPVKRSSKRKFVYQRKPSIKALTSNGYPYVVIRPPALSTPIKSLDTSKRKCIWTIPVKIVTTDYLYNRRDKGAEDNDTITEDIMNTLDNKANLFSLINYGQMDIDYDVSEAEPTVEDNKEVYIRFINLTIMGWRTMR